MKDLILISILAILTSCKSGQNEKLTAEEIWGKYIETFGDKKDVKNIKTYSSTNIASSKFGEIKSEVKLKYPDKVYQEIEYPNNAKVIYIVNGDTGIVKSPKGIEPLSKDDIANFKQMALIFPEIHYKQFGYKMELKNDTVIESIKLYNVEITTDNEIINYLINKNNFQVYQTISGGYITEIIETKIVDGVRLIKSSKSINGENTMTGNYIKYELNGVINDNIFELK